MPKTTQDIDKYNDERDTIAKSLRENIEYILHGFNQGIEGQNIYSFTVKWADSGNCRLVCKATGTDDSGNTVGYVSYSEWGDVEELIALFETRLRWGVVDWRKDKYYKAPNSFDVDPDKLRRVRLSNK